MGTINLEFELDISSAETKIKRFQDELRKIWKQKIELEIWNAKLPNFWSIKSPKFTPEVDLTAFNKALEWLPNKARDTLAQIDKQKLIVFNTKIVWLQETIQQAKQALKDPELTRERQVELKIGINRLSSELTEAKRQLQNYINTWDESLSRLQRKFNGIWDTIRGIWAWSPLAWFFNKLWNWFDWLWYRIDTITSKMQWFAWIVASLWIWAWITSLLKLWMDAEQTSIAFEVMAWSAEKWKKALDGLKKFADVTPFDTEWVVSAGKALLWYWFATDDLIPSLTKVWDIASWLNIPLTELAVLYGKARTQNTLYTQDIKELANRGIPIYEELAKQFWVSTEAINKLASEWKIKFSDLQTAFSNLSWEWWKFFNLMERQSKTAWWLRSTFTSNLKNIFTEVWLQINETAKPLIDSISSITSSLLELIKENPKITTAISILVWWFGALSVGIIWFTTVLPFLTSWLTALWTALGILTWPIWIAIAWIWALYLAYQNNFLWLADIVNWFVSSISPQLQWIATIVSEIFSTILWYVRLFLSTIQSLWNSNFLWIQTITRAFLSFLQTNISITLSIIADIVRWSLAIIYNIFKWISALLKWDWEWLRNAITRIVKIWLWSLSWIVSSLLWWIWSMMSNIFAWISQSAKNRWANIISEFAKWIQSKIDNVVAKVKQVASQIKAYLWVNSPTELWPLSVDQSKRWKNLIQSFTKWVKWWQLWLQRELNDISQKIKDNLDKNANISIKTTRTVENSWNSTNTIDQEKNIITDLQTSAKNLIETINKSITDTSNKIVENIKKIEDIDKKIKDINLSTQDKLSSRFVELSDQIQSLNADISNGNLQGTELENKQSQVAKLQEELELIKQNTTEQERAEAVRVAWLSTTQKILEDKAKQIELLEKEKTTIENNTISLQEELKKQTLQQEWALKTRDLLESQYAQNSLNRVLNLTTKWNELWNAIDRAIKLNNQQTNPWEVKTSDNRVINIQQTINNTSDQEDALEKLRLLLWPNF